MLSGIGMSKAGIPSTTRGAVSPMARESAKITPVKIPGNAAGKTTFLMVCHFVAPIPMEASRKNWGTATNRFLTGNHHNGQN